jgi:uncharacterized protein YceH (UPF0502 family)
MDGKLSSIEVRVLGSLMEKSLTTPEYYPMTVNALTNACNQKSSRHPVTDYTEEEIKNALGTLQQKGFAGRVIAEGARAIKYRYTLPYPFMLNERELPLICLLLLRGAQTSGELRTRSDRMYDYKSLEEVEEMITALQNRETGALVKMLEKQPGQKENRFIQLIGEEEIVVEKAAEEVTVSNKSNLEEEVAALREEVSQLKEKLENFIKQFE